MLLYFVKVKPMRLHEWLIYILKAKTSWIRGTWDKKIAFEDLYFKVVTDRKVSRGCLQSNLRSMTRIMHFSKCKHFRIAGIITWSYSQTCQAFAQHQTFWFRPTCLQNNWKCAMYIILYIYDKVCLIFCFLQSILSDGYY